MKKNTLRLLVLTLVMVFSFASAVFANERTPAGDMLLPTDNALQMSEFLYRTGDGYSEFKIPVEAFNAGIAPRNSMSGNAGNMNANFARGQGLAFSPQVRLDGRDNSIPWWAEITNVTTTFQVASDPWRVGRHTMHIDFQDHAERRWDVETYSNQPTLVNQIQSTSRFNGMDPWGIWSLSLVARRDILNPSTDTGATASVRNVTIRIDWR